MKRKGSIFLIIWASVMTLIVVALVGFEVVRFFGKSNLSAKSVTTTPIMSGEDADVLFAVKIDSMPAKLPQGLFVSVFDKRSAGEV